MSDDFDWSATNGDVILTEQRTTAVYTNTWGQAVIRQERGALDDEDSYVIIDHANIPAMIMALRKIGDQPADRQPPEREPQAELPKQVSSVVVLNEHVAERAREKE